MILSIQSSPLMLPRTRHAPRGEIREGGFSDGITVLRASGARSAPTGAERRSLRQQRCRRWMICHRADHPILPLMHPRPRMLREENLRRQILRWDHGLLRHKPCCSATWSICRWMTGHQACHPIFSPAQGKSAAQRAPGSKKGNSSSTQGSGSPGPLRPPDRIWSALRCVPARRCPECGRRHRPQAR